MITITILVELAVRYSNLSLTPVQLAELLVTTRTFADSDVRTVESFTTHKLSMRLDISTIQDIVSNYSNGHTSYELAARYGVSRNSVLRLVRSHGVQVRLPRMTDQDIQRAAGLYQDGWSLVRISEALTFADTTIHRQLVKAGLVMRDSHGREC